MGCFSCIGGGDSENKNRNKNNYDRVKRDDNRTNPTLDATKVSPYNQVKDSNKKADQSILVNYKDHKDVKSSHGDSKVGSKLRKFVYSEMIAATENFKNDYLLGEGGFGKVYRGKLVDCNQIVAIKRLNKNGCQGLSEFMAEVMCLKTADDPNLVKLIGYCAEGLHKLLVYEYMPLGSLEDHLHGSRPHIKRLDWNTRMKIAAGAARGLEYLHEKMTPPVIYRDLKSSNILLGEGYHPKLSDFGLAKVGPNGGKTHVSTRVMGTYGYCAPDYALTGQLTFKSDIYSFGVLLLELISGRKALDETRSSTERYLVAWVRPLLKDRKLFSRIVDPSLEGKYHTRGLYQALAIAAMCVQEDQKMRPSAADVAKALDYIVSQPYVPQTNLFRDQSSQRLETVNKTQIAKEQE